MMEQSLQNSHQQRQGRFNAADSGFYSHRGVNSSNNNFKEDIMNFSLGYRHIAENNPENYKVLIILQIKVGERKGIRVLVYECDDIKDLASRLRKHVEYHANSFLPLEYQDIFEKSLVFYIESQLQE